MSENEPLGCIRSRLMTYSRQHIICAEDSVGYWNVGRAEKMLHSNYHGYNASRITQGMGLTVAGTHPGNADSGLEAMAKQPAIIWARTYLTGWVP